MQTNNSLESYYTTLGSVDQDILVNSVSLIIGDGREDRIRKIREQAAEIRKRIDARMLQIETLKGNLLLITKAIDKIKTVSLESPSMKMLYSLLTGYASSLRAKIGELRPDEDLEAKARLEVLAEGLEARRELAVAVQQIIDSTRACI